MDVGILVSGQHCPRCLNQRVRYIPVCYSPDDCLLPKQQYVVGNQEFLVIKLALEEWRHWLEGAIKIFSVWTDRKNLTYLQNTKRLKSR